MGHWIVVFFLTVGIDGAHSEIPAFKNCFNKLICQGVAAVQLGKLCCFRKGVKQMMWVLVLVDYSNMSEKNNLSKLDFSNEHNRINTGIHIPTLIIV